MNGAQRITRLQERLLAFGIDAFFITSLENIYYLTGFSGSAAYMAVTANKALLTTDGRYLEQAEKETKSHGVDVEVFVGSGAKQFETLKTFIAQKSQKVKLGFESDNITWALLRHLFSVFGADVSSVSFDLPKLADIEFVPIKDFVEQLREIKDKGEIARIKKACLIADMALQQTKHLLKTEITEKDFATELEYQMKKLSAQGPAFATIVASGPNSALPHARPTERVIKEGDMVVIDFGAKVQGYHSDMTRTFALGVTDTELLELVEAVAIAQEKGLESVKAGVSGGDVDLACRSVLDQKDLGRFFRHGTGHGVGLLIHEAPYLGANSTDILASGSVVTVEPGAYLFSKGGARIEDTMVVTENACEVLTQTAKEFIY